MCGPGEVPAANDRSGRRSPATDAAVRGIFWGAEIVVRENPSKGSVVV